MRHKAFLYFLFSTFYFLSLAGCAVTPYAGSAAKPKITVPGIYHRVERGQTLWRISKTYNVDLDEIAKINRIQDATKIEPGQLIFIPSARKTKPLTAYSSSEEFEWPLKGRVISGFGQNFDDMTNKGLNIQKARNQEVTASRGGKVVFYDRSFSNFGKTVIIDHGDGFSSVYAKNSEVLVKTGDYVRKGEVIARLGSSPGFGEKAYLHFEIRKGYTAQNPYFYLP
ncbi:MAG: LysM peptidoglycan-binding domain-containing M23 family metallopeptidase [Candidatus Omnitrophica bacterium]|nr:LysM peptidoglycan-binding domain-containing M23 family metallopeptidase [Candidatus Omnitrophota bacterium]